MHKRRPSLLLIKHALPDIMPEKPAREWQLSVEGMASCKPLAQALEPYSPSVMFSSEEPKAIRTGEIIAEQLNIPCELHPGLGEQDNRGEPFTTPEDFQASVQRFFETPDTIVYGHESSQAAGERFSTALDAILTQHSNQTVAVTSHGRVIASFIRLHDESIEVFPFWKSLKLASFAVLSLPDFQVQDVVIPS